MEAPESTPAPAVRRHLAFGTLLATAALVAPLVASAGVSLTIARRFGPSGTGVMTLVMNLFDVALMLFTIGLSTGITYLISRREWALRRAAREMRSTAAILGLAGALCGLGFWALTRHGVLRGVTPTYAIVSLASLPFALQWAFAAATALGRDRYEAYAAMEMSFSLVFLLAGVPLVLAFGLIGAVAAFASANVLTAALAALWIRRELSHEPDPPEPDPRAPRALWRAARFGTQTWAANLLQLLNYRLDIFILSAVAARSAVGVYSIAVSVTALGWILPNAFQTVLFPRVASLDAATGEGTLSARSSDDPAARAVRHSVLIIPMTVAALAVLVLIIPVVYGAGFRHSVILGMILIPGVAAAGIAKVASAISSGRGFPKYALYTAAITVPVTLAMYGVLIPLFHATGAAEASTASYVLTTVVILVYLRKATGIALRAALVPSRADLADYVDAIRAARLHVGRA